VEPRSGWYYQFSIFGLELFYSSNKKEQELEHSDRDTDAFFRVMWKGLKDVLEVSLSSQLSSLRGGRPNNGSSSSGAEFVNDLVKSIRRVKETKRLMKEIWEQSKVWPPFCVL
jgi:hypothetical protein